VKRQGITRDDEVSLLEPLRARERDSIFVELTRSICPVCRRVLDAQIHVRDGRVYMKKRCPEHGWFEGIISSDANMYMSASRFNRPGRIPLKFETEIREGCPLDCGLCPDHQQHTCVGIIEVTQNCNLRCPTCFTDSPSGGSLSLRQVEDILDNFVRAEGDPEVVQFSGGEPSVHPEILGMLQAAKDKGIRYVMLNSNGVRLARDPEFVEKVSRIGVVVYLQFDGFTPSTFQTIRGLDLGSVKRDAIENLSKFKVDTVLVSTVQRGVNESEMGEIVDYAMETPIVKGVVFQPTFYTGRHPNFDPMNRVTLPDVVKGIAAQSKFGFRESDFVPIPCCFPTCSSATYVYADENGVVPLPRNVNVEEYLDYFKNRTVVDIDAVAQDAFDSLYSASSIPGSNKMLENYCTVCGIPVDLAEIKEKVKMIMIQPFPDPYTFNVKQVMKCCVHELLPDGRIIPFCAYNNLYRTN
jgi:7,8-dihydro-6-hydroxymethylpterin dimethyltransferase